MADFQQSSYLRNSPFFSEASAGFRLVEGAASQNRGGKREHFRVKHLANQNISVHFKTDDQKAWPKT